MIEVDNKLILCYTVDIALRRRKMNDRFESLMYHAGMTAQGCWDEMDSYQKEAVEKFANLIVSDCIRIMEHAYENKLQLCDAIWNTKIHFEVE